MKSTSIRNISSRRVLVSSVGFTIVELLVVIVVIGILASVTIVSYRGISNKATIATLQSDLSNASKKLKFFQALSPSNSYPVAINCTNTLSTEICLKPTGNSSYTLYNYNNAVNPKTFTLEETNGLLVYRITEGTAPVAVTTIEITSIAAIAGANFNANAVVSAGLIIPVGATVYYSWQSSTEINGVYEEIFGNQYTSNYTITVDDVGKYIKLVVTGIGLYSGTQVSAVSPIITNSDWYNGVASTSMEGKYVSSADLSGCTPLGSGFCGFLYKNNNTSNAAPQSALGIDPDYPSNLSLVSPQAYPAVDFSEYPAQNACKLIGGRLPNMKELSDMYANRDVYGNNFSGMYLSSTEFNNELIMEWYFDMGGMMQLRYKNDGDPVRCVKD